LLCETADVSRRRQELRHGLVKKPASREEVLKLKSDCW